MIETLLTVRHCYCVTVCRWNTFHNVDLINKFKQSYKGTIIKLLIDAKKVDNWKGCLQSATDIVWQSAAETHFIMSI